MSESLHLRGVVRADEPRKAARTRLWPGGRPPGGSPPSSRIDPHLVSLLAPGSFDAEPYRILLAVLEGLRATRPAVTVAVTSAAPGDGKTTTAINLAGMLARLPGGRVLLLDADLRRPSVAEQLGLAGQEELGLARMLRHPQRIRAEGLAPCPELPLSVVAASAQESLPFETLLSPAFADLVASAREAYRYVILDTPPVVALPDTRTLAKLVDGLVMVVRAGVTPRDLLAEALEALPPDRVLGLVFNGDEHPYGGYYGRYRRRFDGVTVDRRPRTA